MFSLLMGRLRWDAEPDLDEQDWAVTMANDIVSANRCLP